MGKGSDILTMLQHAYCQAEAGVNKLALIVSRPCGGRTRHFSSLDVMLVRIHIQFLPFSDLLTTPPGFSNGLDFQAQSRVRPDEADIVVSSPPETVSISELLSGGRLVPDWGSEEEEEEKEEGGKQADDEGGDGVEVSL